MFIFVPKKLFVQFLDNLHNDFLFLKTFNSAFSYIEVWFTDQNSTRLEIEDKVNITLVINQNVKNKNESLSSPI